MNKKKEYPLSHYHKVIKENYDVAQLGKIVLECLVPIINENPSICNIYFSFTQEKLKKLNKTNQIQVLASFLYNKELFDLLMSSLGPQVKKVVYDMILLRKSFRSDMLKAKYDIDTVIEGAVKTYPYNKYGDILNPFWNFFNGIIINQRGLYLGNNEIQVEIVMAFILDNEIRALLLPHIDEQDKVTIKTYREPAAGLKIKNFEKQILTELDLLYSYHLQGKIKVKSKGGVSIMSIKSAQKYAKIEEFYPNAEKKETPLAYFRTAMLMDIFDQSKKIPANLILEEDINDIVKIAKNVLFNTVFKLQIPHEWHAPHLEDLDKLNWQIQNDLYSKEAEYKATINYIKQMLKSHDHNKWLSVDNVIDWLIQLSIIPSMVRYFIASISINPGFLSKYEGYNFHSYRKVQYLHYSHISMPILKSLFGMLAAWGIIEVAYDDKLPINENEYIKNFQIEKGYFSPCDGLKFFRITDLGLYLLGLRKEYKVHSVEENNSIIFDDSHLLIHYKGILKSTKIKIENIAEALNDTLFKVSMDTVLKKSKTNDSALAQIRLLEILLNEVYQNNESIPQIWKDFINELNQRVCWLKNENEGYDIVRLLPTQKKLIDTILRDSELKAYILKAEKYTILIPKQRKKDFINKMRRL
ncbi:MAG: hypothetical protein JJT94_06945, partial [Bernardetiaceae bacterium]|nr:hypothetical protein [Bernardetiaceae bacterium]